MIFSDSPRQKALERMMTQIKGSPPRGSGVMVLCRFEYTAEKRENTKSRLDEIFTIIEALANHPISYDDQIMRQILESVIVESKDRIKVVFVGGLEVTQLV